MEWFPVAFFINFFYLLSVNGHAFLEEIAKISFPLSSPMITFLYYLAFLGSIVEWFTLIFSTEFFLMCELPLLFSGKITD